MSNAQGYELGWDSPIENDSPDFVTRPEGDYDFEVIDFERGRHNGSDKLPPCNKAIVSLKVKGPQGVTIIKHNLFLHSITEGMLCSFFAAIGQRKKGEKITMNWNAVKGAKGRAKIGIHKWISEKTGAELTNNEVKKFYELENSGPQKGYEAGRF